MFSELEDDSEIQHFCLNYRKYFVPFKKGKDVDFAGTTSTLKNILSSGFAAFGRINTAATQIPYDYLFIPEICDLMYQKKLAGKKVL